VKTFIITIAATIEVAPNGAGILPLEGGEELGGERAIAVRVVPHKVAPQLDLLLRGVRAS